MVVQRCCAASRPSRKYYASHARIEVGAFEYTALDAGGKEQSGILEGDTPRHIRQMLRERQLLPVVVSEIAQKEATRQKSKSFTVRGRVSEDDLSLFTRQLAALVRAGLA